jgi:CheY-like chemotaxis protein
MNEHNWPWRILLVEDNPVDEKMVRKCLSKHGIQCELLVLDDGQQAMEYLDELDSKSQFPAPDLVLLDISLPHRNGLDILRRLRASGRCGQTPVIIMTGSEAPENYEEALRNASSYYFQKKADYEAFLELGSVIERVLETDSVNHRKNT